jgi:hypothetical protein
MSTATAAAHRSGNAPRHHRALRKPKAANATDAAKVAAHTHSFKGAGSDARPWEFM